MTPDVLVMLRAYIRARIPEVGAAHAMNEIEEAMAQIRLHGVHTTRTHAMADRALRARISSERPLPLHWAMR